MFVNKITSKLFRPENKIKAGEKMDVAVILGNVTGIKTKTTDYGESTALLGEFEATSLLTGEMYQSAIAWLPPVVTNMVQPQKEGEISQFAITLCIIGDAKSSVGYQWTFKPLAPVESALSGLKKKLEKENLLPEYKPEIAPVEKKK